MMLYRVILTHTTGRGYKTVEHLSNIHLFSKVLCLISAAGMFP